MLYLTCTMLSSVDLAHYRVSGTTDWVSVDCGTKENKANECKMLIKFGLIFRLNYSSVSLFSFVCKTKIQFPITCTLKSQFISEQELFCIMVYGNGKVCTVKTLNNGTPRPATVVVLNIKQFNFTMK